ncbi:MAG: hypothetical protein KKA90_04345 [Nanoarchaeota archaeon]|nr:hypothetical protein [Nanoarchaeota archaeon]
MGRAIFFLALMFSLSITVTTAASPNNLLEITLTQNTTAGTVTLPNEGTKLPTQHSNKTGIGDTYLVHTVGNSVAALVFSQTNPHSIVYNQTTGQVTLQLRQNLTPSQAFLVFTKGDERTVLDHLTDITSSTFLTKPMPSFAFATNKYAVRFIMNISGVNLTTPLLLKKGIQTIEIANDQGSVNGTVNIAITRP